jgi:hypothetical protein
MFRGARSELLTRDDAPVVRSTSPVGADAGLAAIAAAVACNEPLYTFLFAPALYPATENQVAFWTADVALLLLGFVVVRRSRVARAVDVATTIVATLALLALVEATFGGLRVLTTRGAHVKAGTFLKTGHRGDPNLGDKPVPSTRKSHTHTLDGRTVYDVEYSIDAEGRRVTPQTNVAARTDFLVFFGCSYTFGEGLQDDETLPAQAAADAPGSHAYNYGFPGYGPHQMLAQLQGENLRAQVPEAHGIAVYTFIDHHVRRANGTSDALWGYLWDGPYFVVGGDGALVRHGGFRRDRPLRTFFDYLVSRSQTAQFFNRSFPPTTDAHVDLTVRIIAASRDQFAAQFGSDAFYVVIYPRSKIDIAARLQRAGVKVLDYSHLFDGRDGMFIENDGHPAAAGNRVLARQLTTDLGIAAAE